MWGPSCRNYCEQRQQRFWEHILPIYNQDLPIYRPNLAILVPIINTCWTHAQIAFIQNHLWLQTRAGRRAIISTARPPRPCAGLFNFCNSAGDCRKKVVFCTFLHDTVSSLMANRGRATNLRHNMSSVWTPVINTAWSWLPYNWPIYYLDVSMDPSIHLNSIYRSELLRPTSFHIPVHISIFTSFQLRCQSSSRPCEQITAQCLSLT